MSGLVALTTAVAVLSALGPAVRRPRPSRGVEPTASPAATDRAVDLPGLLLGVAARLRAGADPDRAWAVALGGRRGPPTLEQLERALAPRPARGARVRRRGSRRADAETAATARAVLAAVAVAGELGAPLAPVLEALAGAVSDRADESAARAAALAGPRATARVLGWLPLGGLALAASMGAQPWQALADRGVGTLSGTAGLVLLALGRLWSDRLVDRAGRAGDEA